MLIRFVKSWRNKKPGDVSDWPGGAADLLIRRHLAEAVKPESGKPRAESEKRLVKAQPKGAR